MNEPSDRRPLRLTLYTDAVSLGGAEQVAKTLLASLGSHVTASVLGVDGDVAEWIAEGRPGTTARVVRSVSAKVDIRPIAEHGKAIRELRPDIFHANLRTTFACRYGIALALAMPGVRVLAVEHLPMPGSSRFQRLHKRLMSKRLAAHVAVGEQSARYTEEIVGLPAGSVRVIHNGVPLHSSRPVPRAAPGPIVGAVGRIDHQKGLDVLVRAIAVLPDVTAVIVGDGSERPHLERLATELGVSDRMIVTGWQEDPRSYLSTFDVYCLPSRYEGFPLAVIEAMLAERPIVASDVSSVAEAVRDGETGLLVPSGDAQALARAIARLLRDRELATNLACRAREVALERFTAERMARAYEDLYEEVLRSTDGR